VARDIGINKVYIVWPMASDTDQDAPEPFQDLEQRFFDLSIDMLCVLGFTGYFTRLNPAWETTLGFRREEMMARPFIEFVHPDDRDRTLGQNRDVRGGGKARLFENRYLCKDGSYKWLLWNARPDFDRQLIYAVARDITARKQADEERERLVRELQNALAEVKVLQSFLPICSYCKSIRDDENYWQSVEAYISKHTNTQFSHGICPTCYANRVAPLFGEGD
jgi:PAS domain S-box-containing protein